MRDAVHRGVPDQDHCGDHCQSVLPEGGCRQRGEDGMSRVNIIVTVCIIISGVRVRGSEFIAIRGLLGVFLAHGQTVQNFRTFQDFGIFLDIDELTSFVTGGKLVTALLIGSSFATTWVIVNIGNTLHPTHALPTPFLGAVTWQCCKLE